MNRVYGVVALLALTLQACGKDDPAPQPAAAVTTTLNPADYLAQSTTPDGAGAPQRASDSLAYRRFDLGLHSQASDTVVADDGRSFITTWDYAPYGSFEAAGDGGEVYLVENAGDTRRVRIDYTQDGGHAKIQYFTTAGDGGTGWVVFDDKTPQGAWKCMTARLGNASTPGGSANLVPSYTCWRRDLLTIPFEISGQRINMQLDAIVSEHHTGSTVDSAPIERFVFAKGWGRLIWEYWGGIGPGVIQDISTRCPGVGGLADPPGLSRADCRYSTLIEPQAGSVSVTSFGWPVSSAVPKGQSGGG